MNSLDEYYAVVVAALSGPPSHRKPRNTERVVAGSHPRMLLPLRTQQRLQTPCWCVFSISPATCSSPWCCC